MSEVNTASLGVIDMAREYLPEIRVFPTLLKGYFAVCWKCKRIFTSQYKDSLKAQVFTHNLAHDIKSSGGR